MIYLSVSGNPDTPFDYRQCWGSDGVHDWDKTQVYNNTIYTVDAKVPIHITGCPPKKSTLTLPEAQGKGYDPGTKHIPSFPTDAELTAQITAVLGSYE